jgi:hypothetical protein
MLGADERTRSGMAARTSYVKCPKSTVAHLLKSRMRRWRMSHSTSTNSAALSITALRRVFGCPRVPRRRRCKLMHSSGTSQVMSKRTRGPVSRRKHPQSQLPAQRAVGGSIVRLKSKNKTGVCNADSAAETIFLRAAAKSFRTGVFEHGGICVPHPRDVARFRLDCRTRRRI